LRDETKTQVQQRQLSCKAFYQRETEMTNETKQTAVDFLMGKLFDPSTMVQEQIQWFEQAKEMEKEQIKNAWIDDRFPLDKEWVKQCAESYYNETYGGNK
jgi:hypothetical protein